MVDKDLDKCQRLPNPLVKFYADSGKLSEIFRVEPHLLKEATSSLVRRTLFFYAAQPANVLGLPGVSDGVLNQIDYILSRGGDYILEGGLSDPRCDELNDVTEEGDAPVFGQLPDGSWLVFDPRMVLEENALETHIPDGGGLVRTLTAMQTRCSNGELKRNARFSATSIIRARLNTFFACSSRPQLPAHSSMKKRALCRILTWLAVLRALPICPSS